MATTAITADMVKKLRDQTGAGMMECKNALTEAKGDFDEANTILRKRGLASAAKKAGRATTEGLIDNLRAVGGVEVAGLIREQLPLDDGTITANRVSLRSRGTIDVSRVARKSAGGGHKQAAGFSHPGSVDDIRRFIVSEIAAQLAEPAA